MRFFGRLAQMPHSIRSNSQRTTRSRRSPAGCPLITPFSGVTCQDATEGRCGYRWQRPGREAARSAPQSCERRPQSNEPALLPPLPSGVGTRVGRPGAWMPLQSRVLCRHVHHASGRYVITNDRNPPPGYTLQYDLGCLRGLQFPGTVSLVMRERDGQTEFAVREPAALDAPELLGFVEQAPLPLFDPLQVARVRQTGQFVLVSGADDPIRGLVEDVTFIGFIEPYPIHPRQPPHVDVDLRARRAHPRSRSTGAAPSLRRGLRARRRACWRARGHVRRADRRLHSPVHRSGGSRWSAMATDQWAAGASQRGALDRGSDHVDQGRPHETEDPGRRPSRL